MLRPAAPRSAGPRGVPQQGRLRESPTGPSPAPVRGRRGRSPTVWPALRIGREAPAGLAEPRAGAPGPTGQQVAPAETEALGWGHRKDEDASVLPFLARPGVG